MKGIAAALAAIVVSCTAPAASSPPAVTPTAVPSPPSPTASGSPTPTASPDVRLPDIAVTVTSDPFPIVPSLILQPGRAGEEDESLVRLGAERYLESLDRYRERGSDPSELGLTGAFHDAVVAGIAASATPGVERKFALESFEVERVYRKPWGTRALVDVVVTIVDRAVDGSAPDQREVGLLRMVGHRPHVVDAWDHGNARWYNGNAPSDEAVVRFRVLPLVGGFLRTESWMPGAPAETYFGGGGPTPFSSARAAYVASFDRSLTVERTFADVTATIERYDRFAELDEGLATVLITGTLVTADAAGTTQRAPFERRIVVFFGNWAPEVVDEEIAPGVWRSGGDQALAEIDVNRA